MTGKNTQSPSPKQRAPVRGRGSQRAKASAPTSSAGGKSAPSPLVSLIRVSEAALSAPTIPETAAVLANRFGEIVPCDRVVLVEYGWRAKLMAATGVGQALQDSAFADTVRLVYRRVRKTDEAQILPVEDTENGDDRLIQVQSAMKGTSIMWVPLLIPGGSVRHAMWLERWQGAPWTQDDLDFMKHARVFFTQALISKNALRSPKRRKVVYLVAILVLAVVMMIPVTSSTTSPSRIIPAHPHTVFAPLEGALKELLVEPGENVEKGQVVFRYDARVLDRGLEEANQAVAVARAELARLEGASFTDPDAQSKIPVQALEVEAAEAAAAFAQEQRERADVKVDVPGVVVLDDPDSMIGAPLKVGQSVMTIANLSDTKLEIMVPVSDAGLVQEGADLTVRLDRDPLRTYRARVTRTGFDVIIPETDIPSVRVEAEWLDQPDSLQVGQRGTAKVFSDITRPLWMELFRKPLITIRDLIGV